MEEAEAAERRHHNEVVASMRHYYHFFRRTMLDRMHRHHLQLTGPQVQMLPGGSDGIAEKIEEYEKALFENQLFFDAILMSMGEAPSPLSGGEAEDAEIPYGTWAVPVHHANKLSGVLHSVARDWSREGEGERSESYAPLLADLQRFVVPGSNVLVPGSGLARLATEVSACGMKCQGNDFDLFMLFTANFILNACNKTMPIHPWIHSLCNNVSHSDATRTVMFPDLSAQEVLARTPPAMIKDRDFSMCAGDFEDVYSPEKQSPDSWDALVSCFFIDTAPNILSYIRQIHYLLRPGGVWLNVGPLTYHWADPYSELTPGAGPGADGMADMGDPRYGISIELSWEEVRFAMNKAGFEIEREEFLQCTYSSNDRSMHRAYYNCVHFRARKTLKSSQPLPMGQSGTAEGEHK